jgi:SAM-dependent methyltransferase
MGKPFNPIHYASNTSGDAVMAENLRAIYSTRFRDTGLEKRQRVWKVLCTNYFDALIGKDKDVLDMACGYGEFINNVAARKRYGIDLNQDAAHHLNSDVLFFQTPSTKMTGIADRSVDVVFASNFLEHLPNKATCDSTFVEVLRILRPGGRFIVLGPNIRFAYKEYWDFYDHHLPLSHLSLEEGLRANGFNVILNIPRFLPYTMKSKVPSAALLVKIYLKFPLAWPILGKQFLVIAEKPTRIA